LRHAVDYLKTEEGFAPEIVVWLQANVPIRKKGQIDRLLKGLFDSAADSAVTVSTVEQFPHWMKRMDKNGFLHPFMMVAKNTGGKI